MKRNLFAAVLLFAWPVCLFAGANSQTTLDKFFRPAPDKAKNLSDDWFYPKGKIMCYSLYSVESPQLEKSKEDGFTAVGPYYHQQGPVIGKAKANGVKCFYSVGKKIDFVHDPNYVMPSVKELRKHVIDEVRSVAKNREIAAWNLRNEELRNWKPDEMLWLKTVTDAVRAADPLKRPIMMYEPCHRNAKALAKTVIYQDICVKGMYANGVGMKDKRIWVKWGLDQEVEAVAKANPKATPYAALWMAKDAEPQDAKYIRSWTRHDVYLSLISGAKGITIWSGYNKRKGFKKHFLDYYEGYASAARELNGKKNLSQVFLFGQPRNDISIDVIAGPKELVLDYKGETYQYSPVNFLDVAYGKDRYLFLVNSAKENVTVKVSGLPASRIKRVNLFSDKLDSVKAGSFDLEMQPYEVCGFKFVR